MTEAARSCGDDHDACDVCCTLLAITEIGKPTSTRCPSQLRLDGAGEGRSHGCAVYDTRPASCAGWSCLWLRGLGDAHLDRPDRCGVMFDVRKANGEAQVFASETEPGAFDSERGRSAMVRMCQDTDRALLLCRLSDVQTPVGVFGREAQCGKVSDDIGLIFPTRSENGLVGEDIAEPVVRAPSGEVLVER